MKYLKFISPLVLITFFLIVSCRSEETILEPGTNESTLKENTSIANLIQRTTLNDGSVDNIIDNANCLNIKLPVVVVVNGLEIIVDSVEDFETIEEIFDDSDDDDDRVHIMFPITIILSDHSEILVNDEDEFENFIDDCNDENEFDDDIECLDFKYPINISVFNTVSEQRESFVINNDREMHHFIENLSENDLATITFPITVILFDGSEQTINDLEELEDVIDDVEDDCDEDDDYDYDDDDCVNCTPNQLTTLLTSCSDWFVDKLEINDNDLDDNYAGYAFNFMSDGSISVQEGTNNFSGTWSASGAGQNIEVEISISGLPDFNATWRLHEIEDDEDDEKKVDLRIGKDNRLRFESDCN